MFMSDDLMELVKIGIILAILAFVVTPILFGILDQVPQEQENTQETEIIWNDETVSPEELWNSNLGLAIKILAPVSIISTGALLVLLRHKGLI